MWMKISKGGRAFCLIFGCLTLIVLGHDVYLWRSSGNDVFAFSDLGGLFRHYANNQFRASVQLLGADRFDLLVSPFLRLPAVVAGILLTGLSFGYGWLRFRYGPAPKTGRQRVDTNRSYPKINKPNSK